MTCAVALSAVLVAGCVGEPPASRDLHLGSLAATPTDLVTFAAEVRDRGGSVFVGRVSSIDPIVPVLAPGPTADTRLAYPTVIATFAVNDALGEPLPGIVQAIARAGPAVVVDEDGVVDESWSVSGEPPELLAHLVPPELGSTAVFFVWERLDGSGPLLRWVATLDGDLVDGELTGSGEPASLSGLRR